MKRRASDEQKKVADDANKKLKTSGEFSATDGPSIVATCETEEKPKPQRKKSAALLRGMDPNAIIGETRRASTSEATEKLNKEKKRQSQPRFANRPHRKKEQELIEKNRAELDDDTDSNEVLNAAIKKKLIWSGFRNKTDDGQPGIDWSSGFADAWWDEQQDTNGMWACSIKGPECLMPAPVPSHSGLEIGHMNGFYIKMNDVRTVVVCDGATHWEVLLVKDVVKANEDETNLHPQCKKCNRDKKQRKKDRDSDDPSFGFKPQRKGDCPGEGTCEVERRLDLDGDFV